MKQMSLTLEAGIGTRNRTLREHMATRIYGAGLVTVAGKMDVAPSKLTEKLAGSDSGGKPRGMTIDELERYIEETDDFSPIHYLVDKYLHDPEIAKQEAAARFVKLMEEILPLAQAAGIVSGGRRR